MKSYSFIVTAFLFVTLPCTGQYYYKDILSTRQINQQYQLLRSNKVSTVSFATFIGNQPVQDGIQLAQTINAAKNTVTTHTNTSDAGENWLKANYNTQGQLIKSTDSTEETVTVTTYQYNAAGQLTTLQSATTYKNFPAITEAHHWQYNTNGQPARMVKVKNSTDTTLVNFDYDEQGNIAEERATQKNRLLAKTFYYYDAQNRLTDIARFNVKANRILPDYMFEYNEQLQLTRQIIVPEGSNDYQIWQYSYYPNGLKKMEAVYNKQKQLQGKVEFAYQY
jgi:YD repeat-containing protein